MTDLDTRNRQFTVTIRGYDRAQVDERIGQLERLLAAAEGRARDAEMEFGFDEHAAIGPRIAEIFALAEAEARTIIQAAEKNATTITERAEREHVVMFAELEQERERIRDEVALLERRKADAIGELHRLRELLGEVAGAVGRQAELHGRTDTIATVIEPADETMELPAVTLDTTDPDIATATDPEAEITGDPSEGA